jgi:hypothetical protein
LWSATSADSGKTWSKNTKIYASPDGHICECCHPSATFLSENKVVVMWRNWLDGARDMFATVSEDAGKTFGKAFKLGKGTWKLNACPMDGGSVAAIGDDEWVSAWRRERSVFLASASGEEELISPQSEQPVITSANGDAYIVWQTGKKLFWKRMGRQPQLLDENGGFAAVTADGKRPPLVVWESNGTIKVQLLKSP